MCVCAKEADIRVYFVAVKLSHHLKERLFWITFLWSMILHY